VGIETTPLTAMTYNVKNPDPAHAWPSRLPLLLDVIRRNAPDVLGVQEAFAHQLDDLVAGLDGYVVSGQGREGGDAGEWSALLHRDDVLERVGGEEFWLSDTPDVPVSNTWGSLFPRMVTVGRFRVRATGEPLTVAVTHFDHEENAHGDEVRRRSAELLASRLEGAEGAVVVLGDFNEGAGTGPATTPFVDAGFRDAWALGGDQSDTTSTFNDWEPPVDEGVRIDWVLVRGPIAVDGASIDHDGPETWAASDHFPVVARVRVGADVDAVVS
jgi:endonuclease/exonuclease/phosphatase family metal-dependent hydrolase